MLLDHLHFEFKRSVLNSSVLHWYLLSMSTLTIKGTNIISIVYRCCTFGVLCSHFAVGKMIDFENGIIRMIYFYLCISIMIGFLYIIWMIDFPNSISYTTTFHQRASLLHQKSYSYHQPSLASPYRMQQFV